MEASRNQVEGARRAGVEVGAARTLAQSFCLLGGLALIAAGILGFPFASGDFGTGEAVQGDDFIVFEVNGWHNVVHIASGAFLVLMSFNPASAAVGALAFGLLYVVVTVWGFIDGSDLINVVPVDSPDNFLHLALAAAGIVVGLAAGALGLSGRRERQAVEAGAGSRPPRGPGGPRPGPRGPGA